MLIWSVIIFKDFSAPGNQREVFHNEVLRNESLRNEKPDPPSSGAFKQ